jgi:hypothetical protein
MNTIRCGKSPEERSGDVSNEKPLTFGTFVLRELTAKDAIKRAMEKIVSDAVENWSAGSRLRRLFTSPLKKNLMAFFIPPPTDDTVSDDQRTEIANAYLEEWLRATDFGELKETIDLLAEDAGESIQRFCQIFWEYPAKAVCLLSCFPTWLNFTVTALKSVLAPLSRMSPELQADILAAFAREVQAEQIAQTINEISGLACKLNTGSALLGGPGKSLFAKGSSDFFTAIVNHLDTDLLLKGIDAANETNESIQIAMVEAISEDRKLSRRYIHRHCKAMTAKIRSLNRKAEILERFFSDDELAAFMGEAFSEVEARDLADGINRFLRLLNTRHRNRKETEQRFLTEFVSALDINEILPVMQSMIDEAVELIRPAAPEVMPQVIKGLTSLIKSADNGSNDTLKEALADFSEAVHSWKRNE